MNSITLDEEKCYNLALNINYSICYDTIIDIIFEKGYGSLTKTFFRNDNNFIINEIASFYDEFYPNPNILLLFFKKLGFKITSIDIYNNKLNIIENYTSWAKRKTIDKKLLKQKNLKIYLEIALLYINLNIEILNPEFEDIYIFIKKIKSYEDNISFNNNIPSSGRPTFTFQLPLVKRDYYYKEDFIIKNLLKEFKYVELSNNDIADIFMTCKNVNNCKNKLDNFEKERKITSVQRKQLELKLVSTIFDIDYLNRNLSELLKQIEIEKKEENNKDEEKFYKLFISKFLYGSDMSFDLKDLQKLIKRNSFNNFNYMINNIYYRFKKISKNNILYNDMLIDLKIQKKNAEKLLLI